MRASGPSNNWELKTREILRSVLPEYDIDPHMRLSNVVKGRIAATQQMAMYEIDFCVREKATGFVICAVELDGWQHETINGNRKDAKKNKWLEEAGIRLIRIKHPNEAAKIRAILSRSPKPQIKYAFEHSPSIFEKKFKAGIKYSVMTISFVLIMLFIMNKAVNKLTNNMTEQRIKAINANQKAAEDLAENNQQRQLEAAKQIIYQPYTPPAAIPVTPTYTPPPANREYFAAEVSKVNFDKIYKKSSECENPPSMRMMVQCSNDYIREKSKFDAAHGNQ